MLIKLNLIRLAFFINLFLLAACNKDDSVSYPFISEGDYLGNYFPTDGWRYCEPEQVNMSTEKLKEVRDYVATSEYLSDGLIIIKDGYIVCEDYFGNFTQETYHTSYSVAKSFVSSLVGIAIDKGYINSVDDYVSEYLTQLQAANVQAEKKDLTLRHLLTMSTGFEWNEDDYSDYENNDVYVMSAQSDNYIDYVLSLDIIHEPGTYWHYNSGVSMLISGVVESATDMTAFEFAQDNLFNHIGINNISWASDPSGATIGGWGVNAPLYEFAKFGYLYLNDGNWDGTQVVPESYISESVSPVTENVPYYGYQWWLTPGFTGYTSSGIPDDTFFAWGIRGQYVIVIPSHNIVIVRMGHESTAGTLLSKQRLMNLTLAAIEN